MVEYIPFIIGAGLFIGSIFSGIWKGKKEMGDGKKEVIAGVIQDNYSMMMMTEQLRENKLCMEKVVATMHELINSNERLREEIKDLERSMR